MNLFFCNDFGFYDTWNKAGNILEADGFSIDIMGIKEYRKMKF